MVHFSVPLLRNGLLLMVLSLNMAGCSSTKQSNDPTPSSRATSVDVVATVNAQATRIADLERTGTSVPQAAPTASSTLPPQSIEVSPTAKIADSPCQADRWQIKSYSINESASTPGLKIVWLAFAVTNGSSQWGTLEVVGNKTPVYVTTEGGFKYSAIVPPSNTMRFKTGFYTPKLIPPGITTIGIYAHGALTPPVEFYSLPFEVAETQKQFTITFPTIVVTCLGANQTMNLETIGPISLLFDVSQPDAYLYSFDSLPLFNVPVDLPSLGKLDFVEGYDALSQFQTYTRLSLTFKFTNSSSGYKAAGVLNGYVIGDEGIIRDTTTIENPEGRFDAGPNQSVEFNHHFVNHRNAAKYAYVLLSVMGVGGSEMPMYKAFQLPHGVRVIPTQAPAPSATEVRRPTEAPRPAP